MAIYKLFDNDDKEKVTILVDGDEGPSQEDRHRATRVSGGFVLRGFLFGLSCLFLLLLVVSAVSLSFVFALNLFTLFQLDQSRNLLRRYWGRVCMYLALLVGTSIGLFSPTLGVGFMLLYFLLSPESAAPGSFNHGLRQALKAVLERRL